MIECAGVGYACTVAPSTLATLRRGDDATILTEMIVRDDSMTLFGFSDDSSRALFRLLQAVSGLGPQMAFGIIAALPSAEIVAAIAAGDEKTLQKLPRVGKKMASRLVVELKDKVGSLGVGDGAVERNDASSGTEGSESVIEALLGLGFTEKEANHALASVQHEDGTTLTASELLRGALSCLGSKK